MSDGCATNGGHAVVQFTTMKDRLRAEAAIEPDPVATGAATKKTQIIAIYGKGGIGKSFTLANLSYMMAQQGKKVLLIGCDPKSDTTSLLFGGRACPTIIETSSRKKLAGEAVAIGDVCFKRDGVFAMELGGPEVGRGCGGRGIIHGFETLEKLGFHDWGFDYVLLDFLGGHPLSIQLVVPHLHNNTPEKLIAEFGAVVEASGALVQGRLGNNQIDQGMLLMVARSPEDELMAFLESTYDVGARLAKWDRATLEL